LSVDGESGFLNEDLSLIKETSLMNEDRMEGKWKQMKGALKSRWGKLTDDDLDVIEGQKDQLVGKVQERYGIAKDEAQKQVDEWNRVNRETENREVEAERQRKAS
jgi:uncharacterized protein YjbJ (UPF0337 family)